MVIDVKIYLYGLKKTCLGVLDREDRDKDNETGLKEGSGIEMSTTVLPFACRSFALILLTIEKTPKYFFQVPLESSCFLEYDGVD